MKDSNKMLILERENLYKQLKNEVVNSEKRLEIKSNIKMLSNLIEGNNYINNIIKKRKSTSISVRVASIIVFEDDLIFNDPDRENYTLGAVVKKASVLYKLANRDKKKLISLDHLHPEKPCTYFEIKRIKPTGHKRVINSIIKNADWLIDKNKTLISFQRIHTEIINC
ncbi:hypothetical protein [Olleya sp. R77988]|uniref:hypothetical protein n=1 Tax=Olleya sp. R77988 TaxID=3093875 RepID=UPI0037CB4667